MNLHKILLFFFITSLLASCATPLKKSQLESISTIAIENQFDQNPRYMIIGSTIFKNKVSVIDSIEFKSYLSDKTKMYLESIGYKVVLVTDDNNTGYDLLLKLRPTSVYQAEYMQGYGVVEKYFLGESHGPGAYISMAIDPYVNGKSPGVLSIYSTNAIVPVDIEHLADTWDELSAEQHSKINTSLRAAIEQAVGDVLSEIGL